MEHLKAGGKRLRTAPFTAAPVALLGGLAELSSAQSNSSSGQGSHSPDDQTPRSRSWQVSGAWKTAGAMALLLFFVTNGETAPVKFWPSEGVAVTTATGIQLGAVAVGDGGGGAIFVWEDNRISHGNPDLFGQRVNANGVGPWQVNGVPLTAVPSSAEYSPSITSDGAGGAIFAWQDLRTLQSDIYAQRVNANGVSQWQANGVPVSTACWPGGVCANHKQKPQVASDGAGGAIITWYEMRDGFHSSVWAQRVDANGTPLWPLDGVPVVAGSFHADFPKVISDGGGGAIIAWQDSRSGGIYAQRLDGNGVAQWQANGIAVSPGIAQRGLGGHVLIGDGDGGAIVAWVDGRTGVDANIYAQRLDGAGQIQWQAGGVPVVTRSGHQYSPAMVTDSAGGAVITWEDQGASPPGSGQQWILAQRVSALGVPLWTPDGISICTSCHGYSPSIVSDGAGGSIIVWDEFVLGPRILAQRVNGTGIALWTPNGFEVYSQPGGNYGFGPRSVSDGAGGVIIYWTDYRLDNGTEVARDIFAQRVNDQLPPPPTVDLTVSLAGAGSGTVSSSPAGINCGVNCTARFNEGMAVTLTAAPDAGSSFAGWSGSGCSGFGTCQVVMDAPRSVTAMFNLGTTTIRVPSDFPTIQAAVSAAVEGHTVLVAPGTYFDNINFSGKPITVASEGGPEVTIVDGNLAGSVVTFDSGEGPKSVLRGFTLRRGRANLDTGAGEGGGIMINYSSPTIEGNIVEHNEACLGGGGIAVAFGSPSIQGNTIRYNGREPGCSGAGGGGILVRGYASGTPGVRILDNVISDNAAWAGEGGGIYINAGGPLIIRGNVISRNTAGGINCAGGGGIFTGNSSDPVIIQNLIIGNRANCGGGLFWMVTVSNPGPLLVNNTIADNDSPQGSGIYADGYDAQTRLINNIIFGKAGQTAVFCGDLNDQNQPIFESNNVFTPSGSAYGGICANQTGSNGNISADPLFLDPANGNYQLGPASPSVDAGDGTAPHLPAKDLAGNTRVIDGNGDGLAVVDLGAYELGGTIYSAVLPVSRSAVVGSPVTVFGTIINAGKSQATGCGIALSPTAPAGLALIYQTTDPMTNQVIGTLNTPVSLAIGEAQSFVVALTPSVPFAPFDLPLVFDCENSPSAPTFVGVNTLLISASTTPVPDVVALAATLDGNGIVNIPGASGAGAFAVASVNVGAGGAITVAADTGGATLPVNLTLCETNPGTGRCLQTPAASVATAIASGATPTFAIFVQGTGSAVPFNPAVNRVFVRFREGHLGGTVRGATSVAVRTQ